MLKKLCIYSLVLVSGLEAMEKSDPKPLVPVQVGSAGFSKFLDLPTELQLSIIDRFVKLEVGELTEYDKQITFFGFLTRLSLLLRISKYVSDLIKTVNISTFTPKLSKFVPPYGGFFPKSYAYGALAYELLVDCMGILAQRVVKREKPVEAEVAFAQLIRGLNKITKCQVFR